MKRGKHPKLQALTLGLVLCLLTALTITGCGSGKGNSGSSAGNGLNQTVDTPGEENSADTEMEPEQGAKLMVWEAKEQLAYMKELAADFEAEYGVPVSV